MHRERQCSICMLGGQQVGVGVNLWERREVGTETVGERSNGNLPTLKEWSYCAVSHTPIGKGKVHSIAVSWWIGM